MTTETAKVLEVFVTGVLIGITLLGGAFYAKDMIKEPEKKGTMTHKSE